MEDRLIELESRLMFQEDMIQRLNDALVLQQRRVDALSRTLETVQARLRQLVVAERYAPELGDQAI